MFVKVHVQLGQRFLVVICHICVHGSSFDHFYFGTRLSVSKDEYSFGTSIHSPLKSLGEVWQLLIAIHHGSRGLLLWTDSPRLLLHSDFLCPSRLDVD